MKHIALQDAKTRFGKIVVEAASPIVITLNGRDAAVLLPLEARVDEKTVQGKRGARRLSEALRAAPGELNPSRLSGRFRPAVL